MTSDTNPMFVLMALEYATRPDRHLGDGRIAMLEKKAFTAGIEAIREKLSYRLDKLCRIVERSEGSEWNRGRLDGALWLYEMLEQEM